MTVFVFLSALLVAGALLLVLPPMLGRGARRRAHAERRAQAEVAIAVLREQLAELKAERAAGRVDEAAFERTHAELEQRVLEEGQAAEVDADPQPSRVAALMLAVLVPLAAGGLYAVIGAPAALDPEARVARPDPTQLTPEQISGLVAQLAERLEQDPSDPTGWAMLARSYMMLGEFDKAQATWANIGSKVPDDAMILADWADLLVAVQQGDFAGEPTQLIERALALDPANFKALALAGAAAFEREDYAAASTHWEGILSQIPPGDPALESVVASINEARSRGGLELIAAPEPVAPAAPVLLSGAVRLGEGLAPELPPEATVFIFVRAPEGGIPFAAIRFPATALPTEFDFARAQRMNDAPMPDEVVLAARVSMSGDASPQPGDLEATPLRVAPGASGLVLVIDRIRE